MRNRWLRQFHFTKNERKGVQALLLLSGVLFIFPYLSKHISQAEKTDYSALEAQLAMLEKAETEDVYVEGVAEIEAFYFDPNTASFDDFVTLGLSERISNRILNYRDKGGKFFDEEDFSKIYGLPTTDYNRLKPFIRMEKKKGRFTTSKKYYENTQKPQRDVVLSNFNPNTATFKDFLMLGLSERTAHSILNYREKGGTFKQKRDFQKIYTLSKEEFERLYAYIELPENELVLASIGPSTYTHNSENTTKPKPDDEPKIIDINTATVMEWQNLKGIGPSYAKRIVNFRNKLGGFAHLEQVGETYGLPDSVFQNIQLWLQPSTVFRPLNINTATEKDFLKHPYISKKQAKLIVAYREQHGAYAQVEDLLHIKILEETWLKKLRPYLTL